MSTTHPLATPADLADLAGRYELIDGEISEMAAAGFEHGLVCNRIAWLLTGFCQANRIPAVVLSGEAGFFLDEHNVRVPDVSLVQAEKAERARREHQTAFPAFAPDLVVEVLSPSDRIGEARKKARIWLTHGSAMVWLVDPWSQTVEVHAPGTQGVVLEGNAALHGAPLMLSFQVEVRELFEIPGLSR